MRWQVGLCKHAFGLTFGRLAPTLLTTELSWIDTHAHLYADTFADEQTAALVRAQTAGVQRIYLPNIDVDSIGPLRALAAAHPAHCFPMMGLHPCSVKADFETQLQRIETELRQHPYVAIGEIGTDLYWDRTFWAQQQVAFRTQVGWAPVFDLPIVIHCRESFTQTIEMLETMAISGLRGVFHCFTGTLDEARRALDLGFHLGIGGVATFKNGGLDKVLPHIGLEKILLETDSPYLAPVPHRGKRNESAYIPLIGRRVAELMGHSVAEVARITTQNALRLLA